MLVRAFKNGDEPALQAVFYSAVHTIAAKDYEVGQLDAWAPHRPDWDAWTARMQALQPFVVEEAGRVVGYADLQASGQVDHFYVSGRYARRGAGRLGLPGHHGGSRRSLRRDCGRPGLRRRGCWSRRPAVLGSRVKSFQVRRPSQRRRGCRSTSSTEQFTTGGAQGRSRAGTAIRRGARAERVLIQRY
jgi:hypothetical protein